MSEFNLETKRLILRNYRTEDYQRVHIYGSMPEFSQYEEWGPNSLEDTKKFVADMVAQATQADRYHFEFAMCLKENNLLIGGCGISKEGQSSSVASMGWAVNPEFQNQGYATEAATKLIQFGFTQLGLHVIYATCDTRNTASFKVMEKLGMNRVGYLKDHKMQKGHMRDSYRYEFNKN